MPKKSTHKPPDSTLNANFNLLFETLSAIDLFGDAPPPVPYPLPPQAAAVGAAIDRGTPLLPQTFRDGYAAPLRTALPNVLARLNPASPDDLGLLETMTGAVYQHSPDSVVAAPLGRFLAVISDLYRSFLSKKRRVAAGFPVLETLPPMAMFQNEGADGPFTLPSDAIQREFGATVGVVSMPAVYAPHPLLWGALCHETGGHDVTHADASLLPELEQGVATFFGTVQGGGASDAQLMGSLWAYWMDEAAADVYGLLNMGPAFGLNLIALFTALNARVETSEPPTPLLRSTSGFDPNDPQKFLDEHPTDVLRPYLAIGVIQSLAALSQAAKDAYSTQLDALTKRCISDPDSVTLAGVIANGSGARIRVSRKLPLAQMQMAARQVGAFIATAQLDALSGHSIQDLETWDDADEQTALGISADMQHGQSVKGMGDDAQLLAGATLAAFAQPGQYPQITALLNEALDESFETDPFWGKPQPHAAFMRKVATFTQLDPITADHICEDCIRKVGSVSGQMQGQDPISKFGFDDQKEIDDLVSALAGNDIGVRTVGFKIPNPSALKISGSTTVSQLVVAVIKAAVPA